MAKLFYVQITCIGAIALPGHGVGSNNSFCSLVWEQQAPSCCKLKVIIHYFLQFVYTVLMLIWDHCDS